MGTLAAGIKDIFSTAKTYGTNVMLSGNDGTPEGHISMANLASVLGVDEHKGYVSDANFESSKNIMAMVDTNTQNTPVPSYGVLCHFAAQNYAFATQILLNYYPDKGAYIRHRWSQWGTWGKIELNIPAFYKSYDSLASLVSAVGVVYKDFNSVVVDLDSLGELKKIVYAGIRGAASGSTNFPDASTNGNFVSFGTSAGFIEFFQTSTNLLYVRLKWGGGSYSNWRQL